MIVFGFNFLQNVFQILCKILQIEKKTKILHEVNKKSKPLFLWTGKVVHRVDA